VSGARRDVSPNLIRRSLSTIALIGRRTLCHCAHHQTRQKHSGSSGRRTSSIGNRQAPRSVVGFHVSTLATRAALTARQASRPAASVKHDGRHECACQHARISGWSAVHSKAGPPRSAPSFSSWLVTSAYRECSRRVFRGCCGSVAASQGCGGTDADLPAPPLTRLTARRPS
jgi:hypothetical protein